MNQRQTLRLYDVDLQQVAITQSQSELEVLRNQLGTGNAIVTAKENALKLAQAQYDTDKARVLRINADEAEKNGRGS